MAESRARNRIRRAVESRGFSVKTLEWESWYNAGEKSGIGGGWCLVVDRRYRKNLWPGDELYGLSVEELLADVDYSLGGTDCGCRGDEFVRHPAIYGSSGPIHKEECEWYIKYRLRWWE